MLDQFWTYEVQPALRLDALLSSHPIFVDVKVRKCIQPTICTLDSDERAIHYFIERTLHNATLTKDVKLLS